MFKALCTFAINKKAKMSQLRSIKIKTALVSVFSKDGLEPLIMEMQRLGIEIISTGGTQSFIESLGVLVTRVEDLTHYPSILDGRVKTLHPKIFGGILAMREQDHLLQLEKYDIPEIDMVVVDLYPFEKTVESGSEDYEIIEKIDIGGISLIRAAAKNFRDVVIIPSVAQYKQAMEILRDQEGVSIYDQRQKLARKAFGVSSHYDTAILSYFNKETHNSSFNQSIESSTSLRYGENPHQKAHYYGDLNQVFDKIQGKDISYNNLVDIDGALQLIAEFKEDKPSFAILKHTNACGVASRDSLLEAWKCALAGDSISAFGGVLIANRSIDLETAENIDKIFYEVLMAPDFDKDALALLTQKKNRTLLKLKAFDQQKTSFKSLLNGVIEHDSDLYKHNPDQWKLATKSAPTEQQLQDLFFANKCVKHLKSNTIVLVKDQMMIGMGCGQTSRVDALKQAITKAEHFGFSLKGAVMASDAFFPFPDCVEIAHLQGISAVIHPGGSIKDQDSIDYCDKNGMAMMLTGIRHFKH